MNSQKLDLLARAIDAVVRESLEQEEEEEEEEVLEEEETDVAHVDLQERLEAAANAAAAAEAVAAIDTPDYEEEEVDDLQERLAAAAKAAAAADVSAVAAAVVAATRENSLNGDQRTEEHHVTEADFNMLDGESESLDNNGVRSKADSDYDDAEPSAAPETDFSGLAEMAMRSAQNMAGDDEGDEDSEEAQRAARAQLLQLMT
jgi:flagellar basal body rod protein FlgB